MNNFDTIPRFAVPYGMRDFTAGIAALCRRRPLPEDAFGEILGGRQKFWTGSGRQALWLMLKALGLKPGAGVAVPLYADCSVPATINDAGLEPVFVDVDKHTLTMDPAALEPVRRHISAVVVLHFFGHVARIKEILEIANGLPVIEDTAHAPLSFLDQQMAGSFGAGCFYSFASTKYWPAGGGGLAVINDPDLAGRVAADVERLVPQRRVDECKALLLQGVKAALFRRPIYGIVGLPLRSRVEQHAILEPTLSRQAIQRPHAAVARRQAGRFPALVSRQRENSLRLLTLLCDVEDVVLPWEWPPARYNYHLFPVVLGDVEERAAVADGMRRRGVDTSRIYFDIVERSRSLGYRGGCPVTESVVPRMLTLPNYAALSSNDIDRVAEAFLMALDAHRSRKRRHVA